MAKVTVTPRVVEREQMRERRVADATSIHGYHTTLKLEKVKTKILLRSVIWTGGRAIGVLTRRQFREIVGSYPRNGFAAPVAHSFIPTLMGVLNVE